MALIRDTTPRVEHWIRRLDDASGIDGTWIDARDPLPAVVTDLLTMAGDLYLPYMAANDEAARRGDDTFSVDLLGHPHEQGVFRYQVKCLAGLRDRLAELTGDPLTRTRAVLEATGCWTFLAPQ